MSTIFHYYYCYIIPFPYVIYPHIPIPVHIHISMRTSQRLFGSVIVFRQRMVRIRLRFEAFFIDKIFNKLFEMAHRTINGKMYLFQPYLLTRCTCMYNCNKIEWKTLRINDLIERNYILFSHIRWTFSWDLNQQIV